MIRFDEQYVSVLNYKRILKVSITEIHIAMIKKIIMISGDDLYIYSLNKDELILKGKILKVEFNERI